MALAAHSVATNKERTNYGRLCCLLVDVGCQALRDTFDRIHAPSSLHTMLASPPIHSILQGLFTSKKISPAQWVKLYPAMRASVSSANFDLGLLLVLLRNICELTPPPTGWDAYPSEVDDGYEADIVRLKCSGITLYSYAEHAAVNDITFNTLWHDIRKTLVRLGGARYGPAIESLETVSMDSAIEEYYEELLHKWQRDDYVIKDQLDEMRNDIKCIKEQVQIMAADSIINQGNKRGPIKGGTSDYSEIGRDFILYSSMRPSSSGDASFHREFNQLRNEERKDIDSTEPDVDQSQSTTFELPSLCENTETLTPIKERSDAAFETTASSSKKDHYPAGATGSTLKTGNSSEGARSYTTLSSHCSHCMRQGQLICKGCLVIICKACQQIFETNLCDSTKGQHVFMELADRKTVGIGTMSNQQRTSNRDDEREWSCNRCTYLNSPEHVICVMCGATRGVDAVEQSKRGVTVCRNCTLHNDEGTKVCVACHKTLDRSETFV